MSKSKTPLLIIIVILFLIKAWPVAIALLIFAFLRNDSSDKNQASKERTMESLQKENEELKRKLGEKIVDDVIAKTESREER